MSPPLQLNDVWNYLGYARLGALHHFNPYTHVIRQEFFDPVYAFSTWHNLRSPYGSLFTALTYPLAFVSLPVAYWTLKVVTVLLSLCFIALVWQCARQLGRDPRFAVVFVAFNPIYLIYAVGGFHNDFFMLVPSMGAISLMLARRDRAVGRRARARDRGQVHRRAAAPVPADRGPHARPPGEVRRRRRARRGSDDRAEPGPVRLLAPQPVRSELAADRLQHPERGRAADRDRRREPGPAADHDRRRGRGRRLRDLPPARLAHRRRLVDVRAAREPRLAGAVVRDLAAAAGGAGDEPRPAPGGVGVHRVPDPDVHAGDRSST